MTKKLKTNMCSRPLFSLNFFIKKGLNYCVFSWCFCPRKDLMTSQNIHLISSTYGWSATYIPTMTTLAKKNIDIHETKYEFLVLDFSASSSFCILLDTSFCNRPYQRNASYFSVNCYFGFTHLIILLDVLKQTCIWNIL